MNETENTRLLRLYKLLWEQIKDNNNVKYIFDYVDRLNCANEERSCLEQHMYENMGNDIFDSETRKAFVQRMIKELGTTN